MRALLLTAITLLVLVPIGPAGAAEPIPGTKLTVQVNSALSGRPIDRASVIVRFKEAKRKIDLKRITTSWETKTNEEGSVTIPEIPQGTVTIQVIAQNFQTFGNTFDLDQPTQTVTIKLNPPQPQYSEDSKSKTVPK